MLKIYGVPTLNTVKVILTAEFLELDYEFVSVDLSKGQQKTPDHLARHPLGKVPVIEHGENTLFESNAICIYLAAESKSSLYPEDPFQQGQVHQWIDMMSFHPGRWLAAHYFEYFIKPTFLGGSADDSELEEANGFLDAQLPVVEDHLAKNAWLCGNNQSVADLVAFSYFHTHEFSGYSLAGYESITRWYQPIRQSDAFDRTAQKLDLPA